MVFGLEKELFGRSFEIQIGNDAVPIKSEDSKYLLNVSFKVSRTSSKEPNTATVTIFNLNESNRMKLQLGSELIPRSPKGSAQIKSYDWPLTIKAGYDVDVKQLFSGDIVFVKIERASVDWVITLEAEDGGLNYASKRINASFDAGTSVAAVLNAAANALEVGVGNSAIKFGNSAAFRKQFTTFKRPVVLTGKVADVLNRYVKSIGYRWSIQDGQLQILGLQDTLLDSEVKLTPSSGLVGSPDIGEKGYISGTSLLQGEIKPGRQLWIESAVVNGRFRCEKVAHSGDTWGNDWYSNFEAKALA